MSKSLTFYLIIFIISSLAFIADLILRYIEKIKSFDVQKKFFNLSSEGFEGVPVEKFLPENLTMLVLSVMAASAGGSLLDLAGLSWYISFPCAVVCGLIICFFVQHLGDNAVDIIKRNRLPKGEKAAGLIGCCVESVEAGGWGKVRFLYKNREFTVNSACTADSGIDAGQEVIAVYEQDGYYFVTKADEIYKGIDTNF
ncbi:MAG: hypothetical protein FWH07_04665 [Oscillospiraceae bacterium]|nr:hypothetical protein [Oscillospiraceae bacterium]